MRTDKKSSQRTDERRPMGDDKQSRSSEENRQQIRVRENTLRTPEYNSGVAVEAAPGTTKTPESIQDMMARMINTRVSAIAEQNNRDSYDEADDFDEEDPEVMPLTHHEVIAMSNEQLQDYAPEGVQLIERQAPQEGDIPVETTVSKDPTPAPAQGSEEGQPTAPETTQSTPT